MEIVDFNPVKETLDKIAVQLVSLLAMCVLAYVVAFIVLRFIRVPGQLAHYLSTAVLLVVMYYSFANGYIQGIQSAQ